MTLEALPLLFDYFDDESYFAELDNVLGRAKPDEIMLLLNFRSARKHMECVVEDCNMPLWCEDFEILRGIDFFNRKKYNKLLVKYTCGSHDDMYEAMTLSKTPLGIHGEDYGCVQI